MRGLLLLLLLRVLLLFLRGLFRLGETHRENRTALAKQFGLLSVLRCLGLGPPFSLSH